MQSTASKYSKGDVVATPLGEMMILEVWGTEKSFRYYGVAEVSYEFATCVYFESELESANA